MRSSYSLIELMGKNRNFDKKKSVVKNEAALPWKIDNLWDEQVNVPMRKDQGTEDVLFYFVDLITQHEFTW